MALSQLGSTQKFTSSGNSTTAKTGTITVESGSRRVMLMFASRGYVNDVTSLFPASVTVGGQTVNAATAEGEALGSANTGSRLYWANESTIAAMSDGSFTITYDSTLGSAFEITVTVIFLQDVDQTAGLVDNGVDPGSAHGGSASVTLTTTSGDWCLGFGDNRGDDSLNTLGSGMTALDTTSPSSSAAEKSGQRIDTITASGASTDVLMTMSSSEGGSLHAVAFTEDTGGGGGGGVTSDQTQATMRGAHRGIMRGVI